MTLYRKLPASFALKLALAATGVLQGIVLARLLGPEGRGVYALAIAIGALAVQAVEAGQGSAAVYFGSRSPELLPQICRNAIWQAVIGGFLAAIVLLLLGASWVAPELSTTGLLASVSLLVPFVLAYHLLRSTLLARGAVHTFNLCELGAQVIALLALAAAWVLGSDSVFTAFVLLRWVATVGAIALVLPKLGLRRPLSGPFDAALARAMIPYGIRAGLFALAGTAIAEVNVFLVSHLLNDEAVGFYALAHRSTRSFAVISLPVVQLLLPHLSAEQESTSPAERWRLTIRSAAGVAVAAFCMALLISLLIRPIIATLYGAAYLPAAVPAAVMMFAQVFGVATEVLLAYLGAEGLPFAVLWILVAALLGQSAAAIPLIRHFAVAGAAIPRLGTEAMLLVVLFCYCDRRSRPGAKPGSGK